MTLTELKTYDALLIVRMRYAKKQKSRKWSQCAYAWRHLTHVPVFARVNDDTRRKWNEKRPSTQLVRSGRVPKHKWKICYWFSTYFVFSVFSMGVRECKTCEHFPQFDFWFIHFHINKGNVEAAATASKYPGINCAYLVIVITVITTIMTLKIMTKK